MSPTKWCNGTARVSLMSSLTELLSHETCYNGIKAIAQCRHSRQQHLHFKLLLFTKPHFRSQASKSPSLSPEPTRTLNDGSSRMKLLGEPQQMPISRNKTMSSHKRVCSARTSESHFMPAQWVS